MERHCERKVEVKQKKFVSMIGVLVVIISAVALITGCPQANGNKDKKESSTINSGSSTGGNNGGSLEVKPTDEASPELKGSDWKGNNPPSMIGHGRPITIKFAENGNIAVISNAEIALYTIQTEKISFDLSSYITSCKNMTEKRYIENEKISTKNEIEQVEKEIKEAEEKSDEQKKNELKQRLAGLKKYLKGLENPDEEVQEDIKEEVDALHKYASMMKSYATFVGSFNETKDELVVEKFPICDTKKDNPDFVKIIFKKQ